MLALGLGPTRRAPRNAACIRASVSCSLYWSPTFLGSPMAIEVPLLGAIAYPANIDHSTVPPTQHEALDHLQSLLSFLAQFERQFYTALLLFDASEGEVWAMASQVESGQRSWNSLDAATDTLSAWKQMAARDGALAIYHFGNTMEAIKRSLPNCAAVNRTVNHQLLSRARARFRKAFPRYEAIRHVVGHVADFAATPAERERHSHKGGAHTVGNVSFDAGTRRQFLGNLYNRSYVVSFKGQVHHYEITRRSALEFSMTKLMIYSAILDPIFMPSAPSS